jgi:hypothetical protein
VKEKAVESREERQERSQPIVFNIGAIDSKFTRLFNARRLAEAEQRVCSAYSGLLEGAVSMPETAVVDLTIAESALHCVRQQIEVNLIDRAHCYSPAQWLWYLRGVPFSCWAGSLPTTSVYDSSLAETLTTKSENVSKPLRKDGIGQYPLNEADADYVSEFCAGARCLSQIHTNLRWVGKGAKIDLSTPFGHVLPSDTLRESVELYDARVSSTPGYYLSRTGSITAERGSDGHESELMVVNRLPTILGQSPRGSLAEIAFSIDFVSLEPLGRLNRIIWETGNRWWFDETALLICFLRVISPLVTSDLASLAKVIRYGWLMTSLSQIQSALRHYFDDALAFASNLFPGVCFPSNLPDLFYLIAEMKGSVWPFRRGSAIRTVGRLFLLDLHAATMMLNESAEFKTRGGAEGDVRGRHFENAVQAVIDQSEWGPPPRLRVKVGFMLRDRGKDVSDLDAIGLKDGILLLVSCKSRIYSDEYDQGNYGTISGTVRLIEGALTKWFNVVRFVQERPHCLKDYDLSGLRVTGVVCLPFVPYLPIGKCTGFVAPGLRTVVSIAELEGWLTGKILV